MRIPKPKISNRTKQILIVLFVLGLLLCIPPLVKAVVNAVGGALGWTEEKIEAIVQGAPVLGTALIVGVIAYAVLDIGAVMVASSVAVVAVVGVVIVVAAVAALVWCGYSVGKVFGLWGSDDDELLQKGQKPDNVKLNGPM